MIQRINRIKTAPYNSLRDEKYLENLICECGLCGESDYQIPKQYHQYFGGLRIWQNPQQLAGYLRLLASYTTEINNYLEIGCRYGGTLILTTEYLNRFRDTPVSIIGIDPKRQDSINIYRKYNSNFKYIESTSKGAKIENLPHDLILIDGDHGYSAIMGDFSNVIDTAKIIVLHDIISKACPNAVRAWSKIKNDYKNSHEIYEYTQYEREYKFFGIGVLISKKIDLKYQISLNQNAF